MSYESLIPMLGIVDQVGYLIIPNKNKQIIVSTTSMFKKLKSKIKSKKNIKLNGGYVISKI